MSVVDQDVRDRALDIGGSFAVSAPAGSGKTGLLVRRILRLLATCDSPEQVLAITFTRKAAAEMQERIIDALNGARSEQPPEDDYERAIWSDARRVLARDAEQGWELTAAPARLRIMTIDSLCRHIARQMAVETSLGDLPEPTDNPDTYYREAIRDFFGHLDRPGTVGDDLALLLDYLDNNLSSLEDLLAGLLARREQWLGPLLSSQQEGARHYLEQTLKNTVGETLAAVGGALLPVESELAMLADYAGANMEQAGKAGPLASLKGLEGLPGAEPTEDNLALWQGLTELLLTKSDGWRQPKGLTKTCGFPTAKESVDPDNAKLRKEQMVEVVARLETEPGLLQLLMDLRNLPGLAYPDNQWRLLEALTRILPLLVAELSVLFKTRHSCDFTEVTLAALNALGSEEEVTDISLKLDYRIHHILVDEFQDTSSLQFRLLKLLTRGWQPDDGRTLFVVGDGMQSLYGFRNANVGIFLEARSLPVNDIYLEPLDLQVNFRSDRTVVDWVNGCFSHIFPRREDISRGAVTYSPAVAARTGLDGCGVSMDILDPEAPTSEEAAQVIERIKQARRQDPAGSIAILVRARSHLAHIIPALQREEIPWEATDIDPLASRMPVIDLHSLTRALLNPADRIAWLAILRAPWCGLTLNDLHTLTHCSAGEQRSSRDFPWIGGQLFSPGVWGQLSDDGRERLARVAGVLQTAWQQRFRQPLRQWVEGTWLALGGPATLLDHHQMAWCQQYLDLLEQQSSGAGIEDMGQFAAALETLYASPPRSGDNPVQVMTIHKSKGLEFDTVILPGLHRGGGRGGSELLYWRERINADGDPELLISPLLSPLDQESESDSRLVSHLKYEGKMKSALEDARVLYVACTRAIKRLHLLFSEPARGPASGSLLAALQPAMEMSTGAGAEHHSHTAEPVAEMETLDTVGFSGIRRLSREWQSPLQPGSEVAGAELVPARRADSDTAGDPAVRHLGTVLHRTLARIAGDGIERWNPDRILRHRTVWDIQLRQLGVTDTGDAVATISRAVETMLGEETGRWLLGDQEESACEQAVGHREGDIAAVSVVDRTFVDGGIRWVVDYKSSEPGAGESTDAFLAREIAGYRDQLQRYGAVFRRMEPGREVRTALYFPLLGRLAVVD